MIERPRIHKVLTLLLIVLLSASLLIYPTTRENQNAAIRQNTESKDAILSNSMRGVIIDSNTTWGINESPIMIDSNHTITQGHILNVTAGATIVFMGNYTITVEGELNCSGNLSHPVIIASNITIPNSSGSRIMVVPGGEFCIDRTEISNITGIIWEGNGSIANTSFRNCTLPAAMNGVSSPSYSLMNTSFNGSVEFDISLNNSNVTILDTLHLFSRNLSVHFNDPASKLHEWVTFSIRTRKDTMEVLENCHLKVGNGTDIIYSTSHYLGNDPTTDSMGMSGDIIMLANISALNGWENITVNISLFIGTGKGEWNTTGNLYRADSMSPRSEITFISPDIYPPEPPAYVKIEQLNNTALNISWVRGTSSDIASHGVFLNDTGNWVQVANITIPKNYSVYSPVEIGNNYRFKIRSYDDMAFPSDFTDAATIPVSDVEPPILLGFGPTGSNISTRAIITIELSEPMDTYSVRSAFGIAPMAHISLDFSHDNRSLNATPFLPLEYSTRYTVNLSTVAMDVSGNHLRENLSFDFTTMPDLIGPRSTSITATHVSGKGKVYLDSKFEFHFNEPINKTSYEEAFSIFPSVAGNQRTIDGNRTFKFQPDDLLDYDTTYRIQLSPTLKDLAGNSMTEHTYYNFTTVSKINISIPEVLDYGPVNENVSIHSDIFLVFSEPMRTDVFAALTITPEIVFAYDRTENNTRFIFSPVRPLKGSTFYDITVSVNAKSLAGYSITSPLNFNFTSHETNPPKHTAILPSPGQKNVDVDAFILFRFDEDIFESEDFVINIKPSVGFTRIINHSNNSLMIGINGTLAHDTEYTVEVGGLADVFGNRMAYYSLIFTTKPVVKKEAPPEVYEYSPLNGSRNVPLDTVIYITFHGPLSPDSVNGRTVRLLADNVTEVVGAIRYDPYDTVIYFDLPGPLEPNYTYTVILDGILSSVDLVPMNAPFIFWFMTREKKDIEPSPPTIISSSPLNGTEIGYNMGDTTIWFHFSVPMDPASFPGNVSISPPVDLTTGLEDGNRRLNITFLEDLLPGTEYVIRIGGSVLDMNGTAMECPFNLTLITKSAPQEKEVEKENWFMENLPAVAVILLLLLFIAIMYMKPKRIERRSGEIPCSQCGKPVLKDDTICWHCKESLGEEEEVEEVEEVEAGEDTSHEESDEETGVEKERENDEESEEEPTGMDVEQGEREAGTKEDEGIPGSSTR